MLCDGLQPLFPRSTQFFIHKPKCLSFADSEKSTLRIKIIVTDGIERFNGRDG